MERNIEQDIDFGLFEKSESRKHYQELQEYKEPRFFIDNQNRILSHVLLGEEKEKDCIRKLHQIQKKIYLCLLTSPGATIAIESLKSKINIFFERCFCGMYNKSEIEINNARNNFFVSLKKAKELDTKRIKMLQNGSSSATLQEIDQEILSVLDKPIFKIEYLRKISSRLKKLRTYKSSKLVIMENDAKIKILNERYIEIRNYLCDHYYRLIFSELKKIVKAHSYPYREINDLFDEGVIGAIKGIERCENICAPITYIVWWIKAYIHRYARIKSTCLKIPYYIWDIRSSFKKERARFYMKNNRLPGVVDVSDVLEINIKKVEGIWGFLTHGRDMLILIPAFMATGMDKRIVQSPYYELEKREIQSVVREILKTLSSRQEKVLTLRYGIDGGGERTLQSIGKYFYFGRERSRQIEKEAILRIKKSSRIKRLELIHR